MARKKKDTSAATAARWSRRRDLSSDGIIQSEVVGERALTDLVEPYCSQLPFPTESMQVVDSVAAPSTASSDGCPDHEAGRRVEELGDGLYLVHDPIIIVCEKFEILVSKPVG